MSISYEIYKKEVGGKTFNGDPMKLFEDLPENIKKAWEAIDRHYRYKIAEMLKSFGVIPNDFN